jgi:hypothetical protein
VVILDGEEQEVFNPETSGDLSKGLESQRRRWIEEDEEDVDGSSEVEVLHIPSRPATHDGRSEHKGYVV